MTNGDVVGPMGQQITGQKLRESLKLTLYIISSVPMVSI